MTFYPTTGAPLICVYCDYEKQHHDDQDRCPGSKWWDGKKWVRVPKVKS